MAEQYLTIGYLSTEDLTRIFSKITTDPTMQFNGSLCWIWTATRTRGGYGLVKWGKKLILPHRLMYAWLVHPLPPGKTSGVLDHLCRNRACCNPVHLEFTTEIENYYRGDVNANKTHCPQGHPYDGDNVLIDEKHKQRLCKTCQREGDLRRYHTNGVRKEYLKKWRQENRDKILQYKRRYYARKKAELKA
jgi:hypothetical protein